MKDIEGYNEGSDARWYAPVISCIAYQHSQDAEHTQSSWRTGYAGYAYWPQATQSGERRAGSPTAQAVDTTMLRQSSAIIASFVQNKNSFFKILLIFQKYISKISHMALRCQK